MTIPLAAVLHAALTAPAVPLPEPCAALTSGERTRALRLMDSLFLYECCDDTIVGCLRGPAPCPLAVRLAANVCRRVAAGHEDDRIRRAISRRARSVLGGGEEAIIDLAGAEPAGDAGAPVTLVVYACPRCPYCARLVPALHAAVTQGPLAGKVRMFLRIFPIRGHPGAAEAALRWQAAATEGRLWPYLLAAYRDFAESAAATSPGWAQAAGLDPRRLEAVAAAEATREAVVASKKEGIRNGVTETPTLFINGVRYVAELDLEEVLDVLEEAAERADSRPAPPRS